MECRHVSNEQSLQTQLKDAIARGDKNAVAALMRQGGVSGLVQTLRAAQAAAAQQATSTASALQVPAAVGNALRQGNLIDAIKRLREANPGLSLKAAKDHVEELANTLPKPRAQGGASSTFAHVHERTPTVVMGERPGTLRWMMVVLGLLALAVWLAFGA